MSSVSSSVSCVSVALHPEGVDRNSRNDCVPHSCVFVALHPEGVDRNLLTPILYHCGDMSPSTRRAWIEIAYAGGHWLPRVSPSTRRAWIEIAMYLDNS